MLGDVPLNARVFNEEPFGPSAAIRTFHRTHWSACLSAEQMTRGTAREVSPRQFRLDASSPF